MKASKMIIPTLKEAPQEAIIDSHILMLRAGLIRKLVSGVYNYLPLGLRSLHKVEKIIKEEMDRSGALEILSSAMQPKELWEESGRWNKYGPELFRFKDRHDRDYCLGPTHEEIFTDLIRNTVKSYKQLPLNIYQIQTKYRDEMRPRFGLMRGREFIMKDAYSFDVDEKGLDESYKIMYETYSRIFTRLGLNFKVVLADTGAIGGNASHQFMALSDIGESNIIYCENCSYAADEEKAYSHAPTLEKEELKDREEVLTINKHSIEEISEFLNLPLYKIAKSMIYYAEDSKQYGMFIVRGDYEVNEIKVANALNSSEVFIRLASDEEILALGSIAGFIGPVNFSKCEIFIDEEVTKMTNFVVGANKKDYHLVNVNCKKDFDGTIGDYKKAKEGDLCPICGKPFERKHNSQKYCSKECAVSAKKQQDKQYYERNKEQLKKVVCSWCGRAFITPNARRKYCSDECRHYAKLEQGSEAKRRFYKKYDSRKMKYMGVGSAWLGAHRHSSEVKEKAAIAAEKRRLKI